MRPAARAAAARNEGGYEENAETSAMAAVAPSRWLASCCGAKLRFPPVLCGPMVLVKRSVSAGGGGSPRARGVASGDLARGEVRMAAEGVLRILSKMRVKISRSRRVIDDRGNSASWWSRFVRGAEANVGGGGRRSAGFGGGV